MHYEDMGLFAISVEHYLSSKYCDSVKAPMSGIKIYCDLYFLLAKTKFAPTTPSTPQRPPSHLITFVRNESSKGSMVFDCK